MKKKPTIIDISKISGFSKSTVSKVIRNESYVKKSTEKKILKVIDELDYQPDEIARTMVLKKTTNFIGLIVSDISNPFYSEIALGVEAEAKKRNCNVILCNTNYFEEEEKRHINILIRNRALGILLATPTIDDKSIKDLLKTKYPFVMIARKVLGIKANRISINHYESAKMAVNYLIEKGHSKIAIFTKFEKGEKIFGIIRRLDGYKAALKENHIMINDNYILKNDLTIKGGYELAKEVIEMKEKPTAIFAVDDQVAIGAIDYFYGEGFKIPDEFSIIGFDNIKLASLKLFNLTTVHQPKFSMGSKAVEILFKQIESASNLKPIDYILETRIVERGSVKAVNVK